MLQLSRTIYKWKDIREKFSGNIILGNGASIALDARFAYASLKQHAVDNGLFTDDVRKIFEFFITDDFELILRIVWQATNVNKSLEIDDEKTENAYVHVRDCLISAVRNIHPEHEEIYGQIPAIYEFLKGFETVISLNYDLIVYWVMMYGRDVDDKHAFKDCFLHSKFDDDWQRFREPTGDQEKCSLVFYPHGNLVLARDKIENERKISSNHLGLLEGILSKWQKGSYVPLFVSEGTSAQKIKSIQGSHYLNTVYREVIPSLSPDLVIYGWGFGDHDLHVIKKIAKSRIQRIAVSVLDYDEAYCNRVYQILRAELDKKCEVIFFDSASLGCWNSPRK